MSHKRQVIMPKLLRLSCYLGKDVIEIGMWSHYETGRPQIGRAALKIKVGKRRKLVSGVIVETCVHHSRDSLADYLYEYAFVPGENSKKKIPVRQ